jgi:hypothetical protein
MPITAKLYPPVGRYKRPWQLLVTSALRPWLTKFQTEDLVLEYLESIGHTEDNATELIRVAKLFGGVRVEIC